MEQGQEGTIRVMSLKDKQPEELARCLSELVAII